MKKNSEEDKKTTKKVVKKDTKVTKKNEEPKNAQKIEVKKESKFKNILKLVGSKIKVFFNHPAPLIVALIAINLFTLLYITRQEDNNLIYVGSVSGTVAVGTVHFFTNNDINYFYASSATYLGEEAKIYSYEIGYYVKDGNELVPFATRSGVLEKSTSLASVVNEQSGWEIPEAYNAHHFFKPEIVKNLDKLYFVINASTKEDSTSADVHYEIEVETTKVTK